MSRNLRDNRKRTIPINYTSRDQVSLREDMENYSRLYYPDTYKNLSENSFGSLMLDLVSMVGDNLSFYNDYQANEQLLDNALEIENILEIGRRRGFKYSGRSSAYGLQTFYCVVPSKTIGEGPDETYYPILKSNTEVLSDAGGLYRLLEDVDFSNERNEIIVAENDATTGLPTFYAIKAHGQIVSGELRTTQISVGNFERFLKVSFADEDYSEIVSISDAEGNVYYEVKNLSQNIVYFSVPNIGRGANSPRSLIRPKVVPRRFTSEFDGENITIQFGAGSDNNVDSVEKTLDPQNVSLKRFGKDYVEDLSFDPTKLINNDKMGITPVNTTLYVVYRANTSITSNASVGSINRIIEPLVQFKDRESLDEDVVLSVINSFETQNENPVTGEVFNIDNEELKMRIRGQHSSQERAVTPQDYTSIIYRMPSQFGSVKRTSVVVDPRSRKRNLNLYVVSEDSEGNLIQTNDVVKENLKFWLNQYKMVNDTIDILDSKIVNFGIEFSILSDETINKYDVLDRCENELELYFENKMDIGENLSITNIYKVLDKVEGVVDVTDVKITNRIGGEYSTTYMDFDQQMSTDGRYIEAPMNIIFELKYPNSDIKGTIQ